MHASLVFTAVVFAATVFASPALETRTCPPGPYKEGSACESDCLGALRCSDNHDDVVCSVSPSHSRCTTCLPFSRFLTFLFSFLLSPLPLQTSSICFLLPLIVTYISSLLLHFIYQVNQQSALNTSMHWGFSRLVLKRQQIQCNDFTWVAYDHCGAPICKMGSC